MEGDGNRGVGDPRRAEGKLVVRAVKLRVHPDKREEFVETVKGLEGPSNSEPGCINYAWYQDPKDENSFLFFGEWEDEAAFEFHHYGTPHVKAYREKAPAFPAEPLQVYSYVAQSFDVFSIEPEDLD